MLASGHNPQRPGLWPGSSRSLNRLPNHRPRARDLAIEFRPKNWASHDEGVHEIVERGLALLGSLAVHFFIAFVPRDWSTSGFFEQTVFAKFAQKATHHPRFV